MEHLIREVTPHLKEFTKTLYPHAVLGLIMFLFAMSVFTFAAYQIVEV